MGPIGCPETSVHNYYSTLRNIPEERRSYVHGGGSLKSRVVRLNFQLRENHAKEGRTYGGTGLRARVGVCERSKTVRAIVSGHCYGQPL
jgi:hypothetical protein